MALCKQPIHLKQAGGIVPCGQCFTCRINKARFWTFRLMMEAALHEKTWWTTLTFDPAMRPDHYISPKDGQIFEHPQGCLNPELFELFIKRVRKKLPPKTFRYFSVGEYGEINNAPHHHICIFGYGHEINSLLQKCWSDPISRIPYGFVDNQHCRPLDTQTARYTVGYTIKKLTKAGSYQLEGRYPEYISSSQGIGIEFAKRYADAMRTASGENHILVAEDIPRTVRFDGKNWPLDRYMRGKILEHLGLTDELLEAGQKRYKKEMSSLSARAALNPKFLPSRTISPYVLEMQYRSETHQAVLNCEKRAKLKGEGKKL